MHTHLLGTIMGNKTNEEQKTKLPELKGVEMAVAHCANFNIRKASRVVAKIYEEHMAPVGLKGTQFTLLVAIYVNSPLTISHLAEGLVMDRTSLTRGLKPLEREGWISIEPDENDRRVRNITMTESGIELAKKAIPLWQTAHAEFLKGIGPETWNQLNGLLQDVISLKN